MLLFNRVCIFFFFFPGGGTCKAQGLILKRSIKIKYMGTTHSAVGDKAAEDRARMNSTNLSFTFACWLNLTWFGLRGFWGPSQLTLC